MPKSIPKALSSAGYAGPNDAGPPGQAPCPEPGPALRAYSLVMRGAAPLAPLLLNLRARHGKEDPERRGERLGQASLTRPPGPLVWFHAASVGETNTILPLIDALKSRSPGLCMLLTTGTVTSAQLAKSRLAEDTIHQFSPLDAPQFVSAFLDHWRPDTAIFAESEIWPNLILELGARLTPLALVNGRLSERSFLRWRRRPGLSAPLFSQVQLALTNTEKTASRFAALGARQVRAVGNLKIDAPPPPADRLELERLRSITSTRPLILAASTHTGEDEIVIQAHRALAGAHQGLLTIVAPRHPDRGASIAELARRAGLQNLRRSAGGEPDPACEIYIADTIGELGLFYALSPVAFIGGSLVPLGGQNPIEAVKHDCAVVTGQFHENFADAYGALIAGTACIAIGSGGELAPALSRLLGDEAALLAMTARARQTIAAMGGALERTIAALQPLLPRSTHQGSDGPEGRCLSGKGPSGKGLVRAS